MLSQKTKRNIFNKWKKSLMISLFKHSINSFFFNYKIHKCSMREFKQFYIQAFIQCYSPYIILFTFYVWFTTSVGVTLPINCPIAFDHSKYWIFCFLKFIQNVNRKRCKIFKWKILSTQQIFELYHAYAWAEFWNRNQPIEFSTILQLNKFSTT